MNCPKCALKKGQRLIIYTDPITQQKPEGYAVLRKFCGADDDGMENWEVHFLGDWMGLTVLRSIMPSLKMRQSQPYKEEPSENL